MRGFIIHPTYEAHGNETFVILCGRLENGESFLIRNRYRPYFYIRQKDLQKALGLARFDYEKTDFINFAKEDVVKILTNIPREVPELRKAFADIPCYEADVRFAYRYMFDLDLQGALEIPLEVENNYEKGEAIDRIYRDIPLLSAESYAPKLTCLSFDIETDMKATRIYCISIVCGNHKEVLMVTDNQNLQNVRACSSEKELLEQFRKTVLDLDPDVITGWNFIDFDLQIIQKRMKAYNIPFDLGRIPNFPSKLRIEGNFFKDSQASIPGRVALDGIQLLKANFIRLEDYKLETASQEILGKGKLMHGHARFEEIERLYKEDQQKLADYNLRDSELVLEIVEKKDLINLTIARSQLTGMEMGRVSAAIASLDSLYLRRTRKLKVVCPSASALGEDENYERIKGGYVMDPKPGIYDYVIVLDFKSLYPSIIRTFNIDPITFDKHGTIVAPNDARFLNTDGLLPQIIQGLWDQRDLAKKQKNDVASFAIKITMNSIFGVLANPNCRFYNLDVANAITSFGRFIIQNTTQLLRQEGFEVIYGDTDSIFIDTTAASTQAAEEIGKTLQKKINDYYKEYVQKNFHRESFLELQYEKTFERFILPKSRHGEGGAKKRYAGLRMKDGKEQIDFTGMEFVRRDWTELAKQFEMEILRRIFHKEEVTGYVKQYIKDLRAGKLDDLLLYRKAIRKPLEGYSKTTPPHVKAARQLQGSLQSHIIDYYMTINGPEPKEMLKSKIDYDHYIEKQLRPIADMVLTFFNTNFDDLVRGNSQKTLFGFE